MGQEAIRPFRSAPRSSQQTVDIGANHRSRVVKREERIPTSALEFALTDHTPSPTRRRFVLRLGELTPNPRWVLRVLIGQDVDLGVNGRQNLLPKLAHLHGSLVDPRPVFSHRYSSERSVSRHLGHAEAQDLAAPRLDNQRDTQGQALGSFKALHLVKLKILQRTGSQASDPFQAIFSGLGSLEKKFPNHGRSICAEQKACPPLGDGGAQEKSREMI